MKIFLILFNIFSFLLIPTEALFFYIPAWFFVLAILLLTAADILYVKKYAKNRKQKIHFPVFNGLIGIFLVIYVFFWPYFGSTVYKLNPHYYIQNDQVTVTQKQALDDLDFTMKKLKHLHVALKDKNSEETKKIDSAYEKAATYIQSRNKLTVIELAQQIESVLSVLQDAHSTVNIGYIQNQHYFKDIQKHNDANDKYLGINGIRYEDLLKEKSNLYSYEKESWAIQEIADHSITMAGLEYLGIDISKGVTYMFEAPDGTVFEETAYPEDYLTYDEYKEYNKAAEAKKTEKKPFCYYSIDEEKSLAIFTLKECNNNQFYSDTLNKLFTEIKQKNIKNLAIDVRDNGGGNSFVINKLFTYLNIDSFVESGTINRYGPLLLHFNNPTKKNHKVTDLVFDGNVYLLCSNTSFSSAMLFAQYVKDNNVGKLIGEAPGNNPNGYGEVVHLDLPNSHLFVQLSRKKFTRINQNTTEIYVEPDYPCDADKAVEILNSLI